MIADVSSSGRGVPPSGEIEYVGGPMHGQREVSDDSRTAIIVPGGVYQRSVRCTDDGAVRYVWHDDVAHAGVDGGVDAQRQHWSRTFATRPDFLGPDPSAPGVAALAQFRAEDVRDLLELGPGQGRDTLLFASAGLTVAALDYAETGLRQITTKAAAFGASIRTLVADVRTPLPLADRTFDACYAHLLFCMALTTPELERLTDEIWRVLRPGGLLIYTVRTTADAHFGVGVDHGGAMYETGGFIVHFFDRILVDRLARGFELLDVAHYEEGKLPRRMIKVTLRKSPQRGANVE